MKQVLALVLVLGLVGCGVPATKEPSTSEAVEVESPTPELTVEPTQTETPSTWQIVHTVDDFGDETDEVCLQQTFSGKFSNTATSNSDLKVVVYYDFYVEDKGSTTGGFTMAFRLLEYNDHKATYSNSDKIVLKVKIDDVVSEYKLIGVVPNGDLFIAEKQFDKSGMYEAPFALAKILSSNKSDISCVINIGSSKYSFTMNGNGFAEQLKAITEIKAEKLP
jgi:hypothetical protein